MRCRLVNAYHRGIGEWNMEPTPENPAPRNEVNDDADDWRVSKKKVKRGLDWLVGVVVLVLVAIIFQPMVCAIPPERLAGSALIAELSSVKMAIDEQLKVNPQTGIDASAADLIPDEISAKYKEHSVRISYKAVARDGAITVFSPELGTLFLLRPRVEEGEVKWSCSGSSIHGERVLPLPCREPLPGNERPPE
jgi:hypothetical protein